MAATPLVRPEQAERTGAAAVHIGAILVPIWVPLIAYVALRNSKPFVAAHARQSLTETLTLNVLILIAMVASITYTVWNVYTMWQSGFEDVDWIAIGWQTLLRMGIWWLAMGVLWLINMVVSIKQTMQALRGEWPKAALKRFARTGRT